MSSFASSARAMKLRFDSSLIVWKRLMCGYAPRHPRTAQIGSARYDPRNFVIATAYFRTPGSPSRMPFSLCLFQVGPGRSSGIGGLEKGERSITDHLGTRPRGVPGILEVEQSGSKPLPRGHLQKAVDRRGSTRILVRIEHRFKIEHVRGRLPIGLQGEVIGQVMGKIRGHEDHRLFASPELFDHPGHDLRFNLPDGQGHDGELVERALKKGQLHLERMLARVRFIPRDDLGQPGGALYPFQVDGDLPQRSLHRVEQRNGQALDAGKMGRPEHDYPANTTVRRAKESVDG